MFRSTLRLLDRAASSASAAAASSSSKPPPTTSPLLRHLRPESLPLAARQLARPRPKNLYEHLAALPSNGVGTRVRQRRWAAKGLDVPADDLLRGPPASHGDPSKQYDHLCYWEVTKVRMRADGMHGKAWGRFVWRGKRVTPEGKQERIRGGLKHFWDAAK